jgi:hypothetical protein
VSAHVRNGRNAARSFDKWDPNTIEGRQRNIEQNRGDVKRNLDAVGALVLQNMIDSKLVEPLTRTKGTHPESCHHANLFLVLKKTDTTSKISTYRIIVDAREANKHVNPTGEGFELFSVEDVINVISRTRELAVSSLRKSFFAVNVDIRHQFHQIPLPERSRNDFIFWLPNGENGYEWYRCVSTPMGHRASPLVGQSLTWALLLARPREERYAVDLDLPDDFNDAAACRAKETMPSWLPLKSGGGIFVLLDNILILTPLAKTADAWSARIKHQSEKYSAALKQEAENWDPQNGRPRIFELREGNGQSFEFLGVKWSFSYRLIEADASEKMPGLSADEAAWSGTHRVMAAVLGTLLWFIRVTMRNPLDEHFRHLRTIYAHIAPNDASWDTHLSTATVPDGDRCLVSLKTLWRERRECRHALYETISLSRVIEMGVSDACASEGLRQCAYILFSQHASLATRVPDFSRNARSWIRACRAWPHHRETTALDELEALTFMIENITRAPSTSTIVAGIDSKTALAWARKGYSRCADALPLIERLYAALQAGSQGRRRLILVWIASQDNAADEPSRSTSTNEEQMISKLRASKLQTSWKALRDGRNATASPDDRGRNIVAEVQQSEAMRTEKKK